MFKAVSDEIRKARNEGREIKEIVFGYSWMKQYAEQVQPFESIDLSEPFVFLGCHSTYSHSLDKPYEIHYKEK